MLYPEFRWVDTAVGGAQNRNRVVDITRWQPPKQAVDCYRTVYRYPDAFKEHRDRTGSVRGYTGLLWADFLPVDLDAADLAEALVTTRAALERLPARFDCPPEAARVYFSGSKGFHLLVPTASWGAEPRADLHRVFQSLAATWLEGLAYDASIYDNLRLFRISNTRNSKSGLYKIPLTMAEVFQLTPDEIRALAQHPRRDVAWPDTDPGPGWAEAYRAVRLASPPPAPGEAGSTAPNRLARPCIGRMLQGVAVGERHAAALRIASHFVHQQVPDEVVVDLLRAWTARNAEPLPPDRVEQELPKVVRDAHQYDFGCHDALRVKYCAGACAYAQAEIVPVPEEAPVEPAAVPRVASAFRVVSQAEAYGLYAAYVQAIEKRRVYLGIGLLDEATRGLAPGEVMQVIARSGVGKTAFALNVLRAVSVAQQVPSLFFSLEMPVPQVFERTVQIAANVPGSEVEAAVRRAEAEQLPDMVEQALVDYRWVYYADQDFLHVEDLEAGLQAAEAKAGEPIRFVVIDYLGRMRAEHARWGYEQVSRIAQDLKDFAKAHQVPVLCLHQTSRASTDGATPVTLDAARDSGVVEEAADFVLGLWRPELAQAHQREYEPLTVGVLKNRRGRTGTIQCYIRKTSLRIGAPHYVVPDSPTSRARARQEGLPIRGDGVESDA